MSDERHDAISRRAYELWEQEGGEHGRHEDHWHRAAGEVEPVNVTAPDGTTMPVATAVEIAGEGQAPEAEEALPAEPADSPAAEPAPPATRRAPRAAKASPAPADTPAKAPAKPRKPKTK